MLGQLEDLPVTTNNMERKNMVREVQDLIQSFETAHDTVNRV
jgi:hypothetical protein